MSHAVGSVRTQSGRILFFEYNGTVDLMLPWLYSSREEMNAHWRRKDPWPECSCEDPPERARIATTYGYGSSWSGQVCLKCMVITGGLSSETQDSEGFQDQERGLPEWWPNDDEKAESAELTDSHR